MTQKIVEPEELSKVIGLIKFECKTNLKDHRGEHFDENPQKIFEVKQKNLKDKFHNKDT